jgi:FdhD protein
MGRISARRSVTRIVVGESRVRRDDTLAVEEPLEIRVAGTALSITMRTPGHDFELATGFLVSEGVIAHGEQVRAIRYCAGAPADENTFNVLDVSLAEGVPLPDPSLARNFYMTSSCGLCGKASVDAVRTLSAHPIDNHATVSDVTLMGLPDALRAGQNVFEKTGGLHAAGLFDAATGQLLVLREDVGRHNAVDKVIGWAAGENLLPLRGAVLMVSGRASFELAQKASMAGIPILAAISAPSSLAIDLAVEVGLTVVGFLRGSTMVVYSGAERVISSQLAAL